MPVLFHVENPVADVQLLLRRHQVVLEDVFAHVVVRVGDVRIAGFCRTAGRLSFVGGKHHDCRRAFGLGQIRRRTVPWRGLRLLLLLLGQRPTAGRSSCWMPSVLRGRIVRVMSRNVVRVRSVRGQGLAIRREIERRDVQLLVAVRERGLLLLIGDMVIVRTAQIEVAGAQIVSGDVGMAVGPRRFDRAELSTQAEFELL